MKLNKSGNGVFSSSPIFLGGLDRSGKTLMRLMLSSHSNIAITRRTYMWSKFYNKFGNIDHDDNFNRCLQAMLNFETINNFDLDEELLRKEFSQGDATYPRLFAIILMQFAESHGKTRWGEQMGMIEQYADQIISAYPDAKIIQMIRDPRDRYSEKLAEGNSKPGKVGWEAQRWLKSSWLSNRNVQRYPGNCLVVRYESYISNPGDTIRNVCEFIGESFEQHMLMMENTIRFGEKPIQLNELQLSNKVDNFNTPRIYRDVLTNGELAYLQYSTNNELQRHDYAIEELRLSVLEKVKYIFYDWPINYAGGMAFKYSSTNLKNN